MATPLEPVDLVGEFDPTAPEYLADPYAHLARLRAQGPCVVDTSRDLWYLVGFDAVEAGLSRIVRGHHRGPDRHVHFPANPFAADGPGHTEPRRIIAPTFSNKAVQQFRDRAQEVVDAALADAVAGGGELRLVDTIGFLLPYTLTCDVLGILDVDNRDELRAWTWQSLELIDAFLTPEQMQEYMASAGLLAQHLHGVIEWKRDHLADDLLSLIIRTADAGEVLRPEQVVPYVHTLYLAGMHTTVNQTALSLLALMHHRDQWDRLCAQPDLLPNAVEELLRFESTAQYMKRTAEEDVDLGGGIVVPTGAEVVCWIASADRDEARWGDTADMLDLTRADAKQHIAFGKGPHVCVGSWLARLELHVVVESIVSRFPDTTMPDQEFVWESNFIRGPEELVLHLA
ncbi:MAG: cytochrome P450 [Actinobacteria bacterium]|nr:cytochrome P450 [Actinomycetota bacterium]